MELRKGYKQTEVGVIPEDWTILKLGELIEFKNGLNKEKKYFGYGTPIINYMDVFKQRGLYSQQIYGKVFLTRSEINAYQAKKGDLFFTRTSETVDEIGISSVLLDDSNDTVFSGFVLRGREKNEKLHNEFKKYCFSERNVRRQIISSASYTTRALTNGRLLSQVLIKVPPIAEQTAIANALSDMNALISSLEQLIEKKKAIKQGAMQELLKPKEGWVRKKLGDMATMSSGGTPLTSNQKYYNGSIPWCVIADITKAGKYINSTEKSITDLGLMNSSARLFKKGVILFAMYASIGKCSISTIDITCNQAILGIEVKAINVDFLYYHLSYNEEKFTKMGQTGTQSNLNKEIVQDLIIPHPDLNEQKRIAGILNTIDQELELLQVKLIKLSQEKQAMMQVLLTGKIRLV